MRGGRTAAQKIPRPTGKHPPAPTAVLAPALAAALLALLALRAARARRAAARLEAFAPHVNQEVAGRYLDPAVAEALAGASLCVPGSPFPGAFRHPTRADACYISLAEPVVAESGARCAPGNAALARLAGIVGVAEDTSIHGIDKFCTLQFRAGATDAEKRGALAALRDANAYALPAVAGLRADRDAWKAEAVKQAPRRRLASRAP